MDDDSHPNSTACPTVSVVGDDGNELRINKKDFDADPGKWQEWGKPSAPSNAKTGKSATNAKTGKLKAGATAENTLTVVNKDDRFYVADGDGNVIDDDERFDHENGYATDNEAWTAAYAQPTTA